LTKFTCLYYIYIHIYILSLIHLLFLSNSNGLFPALLQCVCLFVYYLTVFLITIL
jgi:hypothetical protein